MQMEANGAIERPGLKQLPPFATDQVNLRMVVGTWNVGGKSPHDGVNLSDWLKTNYTPADIYVLGFQEVVPLNAGNVLGPKDCGPAAKWLSLILQALNNMPNNLINPEPEPESDHEEKLYAKPRISSSDLISSEEEFIFEEKDSDRYFSISCSSEDGLPSSTREPVKYLRRRYRLAASKQMVGIFLCVFVGEDLCEYISGLRVSCVGRGILGCLGNKGSISISMTLNGTTFCFVCTHLASGERESDAMRRNLDVLKILNATNFSDSPASTILGHDNIIWLGDLNYRLASISEDTYALLRRKDWQALLEKDQLRKEQKAGRVFNGWKEGEIYFAPTYKYLTNSDQYVVQTSSPKRKRTPAWCDRILWKGEGLRQMCYVRGESRFSDHRPVYSLFLAQTK